MSGGAAAASAGPAPQPALFPALPPVGPSRSEDLVQCRYELHRALDFGGESERAAWCERWGEALMDSALPRREDCYAGAQTPVSSRIAIPERMPKKKRFAK